MAHTKGKLETDGFLLFVRTAPHIKTIVGSTFENAQGPIDAAELVKRWNMHDELVELLANIKKDLCTDKRFAEIDDLLNRAKQGGEG